MKMRSTAFGAVLLSLTSTVNAHAGVVTYSDFASWSLAVPSHTSLTIPEPVPNVEDPDTNLIPGAQYFGTGNASVSYSGVSFTTSAVLSDGSFYNIGPTYSGSNGLSPVLSSQQQTFGEANILITLAAPVRAFALNFDTFYGEDVSFKLSNGDTLTMGSPGNAYDLAGFFGVIGDTPFKTILLTSSGPVLNINDINFEAVSPIPEPATWVMLLLGFFGIALSSVRLTMHRAVALIRLRAVHLGSFGPNTVHKRS